MKIKLSVPLHITGFFVPYFSKNPLKTGSRGAGLVLSPGLECVCQFFSKEKKLKQEIIYNGVNTKIESLEELLKLVKFNKGFSFQIASPVPLGFGYGVSGATTLALSLALSQFKIKSSPTFPLKKEISSQILKVAQLSHIAEVKAFSGLGDVLAIFSGKHLTVRTKPGAPGIGKVKSFEQPKNLRIFTLDLEKKDTKKMLKSITPQIIRFSKKIFKEFLKEITLKNFFKYSQLFAKKMGFVEENFFKKLEPLEKFSLGYSVKKGVLFVVAKEEATKEVISILKKVSPKIHIFKFGGGINFYE